VLPKEYSAIDPNSILWPSHLVSGAARFLERVSVSAGIPADQWRGRHDLALAIAFSDSVPDATLPLFYWEQDGWQPLIRRT